MTADMDYESVIKTHSATIVTAQVIVGCFLCLHVK